MCAQFFHMVSIDVPAGVGAPPLNTTATYVMQLVQACVQLLQVDCIFVTSQGLSQRCALLLVIVICKLHNIQLPAHN